MSGCFDYYKIILLDCAARFAGVLLPCFLKNITTTTHPLIPKILQKNRHLPSQKKSIRKNDPKKPISRPAPLRKKTPPPEINLPNFHPGSGWVKLYSSSPTVRNSVFFFVLDFFFFFLAYFFAFFQFLYFLDFFFPAFDFKFLFGFSGYEVGEF